jgi:hypothetical protein
MVKMEKFYHILSKKKTQRGMRTGQALLINNSSRSSLASLPERWFGVDPVAGVEHSGSISAATSAERSVACSDRWG